MDKSKKMICQICGAETIRRSRAQKYCPSCSDTMRKITRHKKNPIKKRHRKNGGLLEDALEANKLHISYGEYMRMRMMEKKVIST